jgi:hypothetical protein
MKTTGKLQFVLILAVVAVLGYTLSSFSAKNKSENQTVLKALNDVNVEITINSETTQKEFEDIMDMLKEHDIKGSFTNIKRNDIGEIISIKIELEDLNTGSQSVSNMQSTSPIQEISFGRKNKSLYITQGKGRVGNFAFFSNGMSSNHFSMDSIFRHRFKMMDSLRGNMFGFDDEDGNMFMFNGKSFDMDDMMKGMHDMFTIEEDENGDKRIIIKGNKSGGMNFFFNDDEDDSSTFSSGNKTQKFKFYDDPNTEKIIIIDGKESTFERLNSLAKNDKLDSVDVLKGKTAISLYGKKAKDGAIIATTKE